MIDFYDAIGLIGVALNMSNYARLQWQREYAKHMAFSLGNMIGSVLMLISLLHKWNLSAFIVNSLVATISAYGVYRCLKYYFKPSESSNPQA